MRKRAAVPAALILLAVAALTPPAARPAPDPWVEACRLGYRIEGGRRTTVICSYAVLDDTPIRPPDYVRYPDPNEEPRLPYLPSVYAALPTDLRVDGEPACAAGPVGTTETVTLSAAFTVALGPPPDDAVFEFGSSDRGLLAGGLDPDGRATHEFAPGELMPGESVRWRVSARYEFDRLQNWSPWCTFTVAADAPDLSGLGSDAIASLRELGLRPERRYTVTLAAAQWRTALEPFDFVLEDDGDDDEWSQRLGDLGTLIRGQLPDAVTLTGAQWSTVVTEVAHWTHYYQEVVVDEDLDSLPDREVYWAVCDQISTQLGGPPHPRLGYR